MRFSFSQGLNSTLAARDPDHILALVMEIIPQNSCLVFCATKKNCQSVATMLAKSLPQWVYSIWQIMLFRSSANEIGFNSRLNRFTWEIKASVMSWIIFLFSIFRKVELRSLGFGLFDRPHVKKTYRGLKARPKNGKLNLFENNWCFD